MSSYCPFSLISKMLQLHINLGRTLGLLWVAVHLIACHPLDISNFDKSVQITHVGSDHIGFLNASVAICTDPDYPPFRSSLPYLLQDCQRALGQLRGIANEKGEDTRYEFVNATTEPIFPDVKPVRLPLKVISGAPAHKRSARTCHKSVNADRCPQSPVRSR